MPSSEWVRVRWPTVLTSTKDVALRAQLNGLLSSVQHGVLHPAQTVAEGAARVVHVGEPGRGDGHGVDVGRRVGPQDERGTGQRRDPEYGARRRSRPPSQSSRRGYPVASRGAVLKNPGPRVELAPLPSRVQPQRLDHEHPGLDGITIKAPLQAGPTASLVGSPHAP